MCKNTSNLVPQAVPLDQTIDDMQAAAARPGRQRSGVSQFLQHVAAGDVAAFDADGAIPEGDEDEDAASDAGLSDVEVRPDHKPNAVYEAVSCCWEQEGNLLQQRGWP
jgi:hypothetical protein